MSGVRKMHPMWWPAIIAILFFIALLANMRGACGGQWKETVSNLLIGAITSSLVVFLVTACDRLRWYRAFISLAGGWEEYGFCKSNGRILDTTKISGHACISHQRENVLSIKLTHPDAESGIRVWHGQMIMSKEYPHTGRIVYYYEPRSENEHEFGLKEVILRSEYDCDYLYLISINYAEPLKGHCANGDIKLEGTYGKTVLIRKKSIGKQQ